jgi:hypothetical protein
MGSTYYACSSIYTLCNGDEPSRIPGHRFEVCHLRAKVRGWDHSVASFIDLWDICELADLASHDGSARVEMQMHEYFRTHGYICPTDSSNGPFQWVLNTDLPFFDYKVSRPEEQKAFNTFMTGMRSTRKHWADCYPVRERLIDGIDKLATEEITLVDIGGGYGYDLERFLQSSLKLLSNSYFKICHRRSKTSRI